MMVFATQSPADALKSDIAHSILEQVATQVMLPNPKGARRDYVDGFSSPTRNISSSARSCRRNRANSS
jgi:type IV secretory pathway VirB4 component